MTAMVVLLNTQSHRAMWPTCRASWACCDMASWACSVSPGEGQDHRQGPLCWGTDQATQRGRQTHQPGTLVPPCITQTCCGFILPCDILSKSSRPCGPHNVGIPVMCAVQAALAAQISELLLSWKAHHTCNTPTTQLPMPATPLQHNSLLPLVTQHLHPSSPCRPRVHPFPPCMQALLDQCELLFVFAPGPSAAAVRPLPIGARAGCGLSCALCPVPGVCSRSAHEGRSTNAALAFYCSPPHVIRGASLC